MDQSTAIYLIDEMLLNAAYIASPLLITSLVVGLLISVVQVVTQIQEMTLTFVPKIVLAVVVIFLLGGWMLTIAVKFAEKAFHIAALM
ncbi:flagellar biosynthetic protein FliQ [Teredinibacter franksiae]|uniref:flagellar biosynthetic protein FliQ n=1 Tax=Teredinibacter franksiae TaxID=2761453 RepID=UPI001625D04A|nr:flagellar biosynthetic protein FliQ [Teredinibacter franksiae]